jgi:hypothetical protein
MRSRIEKIHERYFYDDRLKFYTKLGEEPVRRTTHAFFLSRHHGLDVETLKKQ